MENKKIFSYLGFGFVILIILGQISTSVLSAAVPAIFTGNVGSMLGNYVGMYVIGLPIFFRLTKKFPKEKIEKKQSSSLKEIFQLYVISLFGMYFINMSFTLIMQLFTKGNTNVIGEMISQMSILQMTFLVVIFAPIIEELIFRKLLYKLLIPFGVKTYIFTSAMIFGLFHLNFSQSLYAFWLGIILASLFYKTGNIIYSIILHMVINFTGSILPLLLMKLNNANTILTVWMYLMIILGFIFFLILRKKIKNNYL